MPDTENGQHWLDRNRPPRVQITYDLETGGAIEKRELPLVVGIFSDLSGETRAEHALPERRFVDVDRDNFNNLLARIAPTLKLQLSDVSAKGDAVPVAAELGFSSLDDFSPLALVQQVPRLRALYENRQRLRDMLAKLDGNAELGAELERTFAQSAGSGASAAAAPIAEAAAAAVKPASDKSTGKAAPAKPADEPG